MMKKTTTKQADDYLSGVVASLCEQHGLWPSHFNPACYEQELKKLNIQPEDIHPSHKEKAQRHYEEKWERFKLEQIQKNPSRRVKVVFPGDPRFGIWNPGNTTATPSITPGCTRIDDLPEVAPAPLQGEKSPAKAIKRGKNTLFGLPITAIMRWMGSDAWTLKDAARALRSLGFQVVESTLQSQLIAGKKGSTNRGEIPNLPEDHIIALYNALEK